MPSQPRSASPPPNPRPSRGVKIVVAFAMAIVAMVTALSYALLRLLNPG